MAACLLLEFLGKYAIIRARFIKFKEFLLGKPKKRTSPRRTGLRRSHLVLKLARRVNAKSPVKVFTTRRESGKKSEAAN